MTDTVEADFNQLREVSNQCDAVAERIAGVDVTIISTDAEAGFPGGASVLSAIRKAESAARRATLILADRAWAISDTINRVAENLENTDDYLAAELGYSVKL